LPRLPGSSAEEFQVAFDVSGSESDPVDDYIEAAIPECAGDCSSIVDVCMNRFRANGTLRRMLSAGK